MFEPDSSRKFIDVKIDQVITLLNSTIRPHVAMAGKPSEPTDAYACTSKQGNLYETLVFFHLTKSHEGVVYKWDEGPQSRDKAKNVEREALKFLEAMGFQMDSMHFRKKTPDDQKRLMETLPCFKPDLVYMKEAEAAAENEVEEVMAEEIGDDEQVESVDEVMVESMNGDALAMAEPVSEGLEAPGEAQPAQSEGEEVELESDMFEEVFDQESAAQEKAEEAGAPLEIAQESDFLDESVAQAAVPEPALEAIPAEEDALPAEAASEEVEMALEAEGIGEPVGEALEFATEAEPVAEGEQGASVELAMEPEVGVAAEPEPEPEPPKMAPTPPPPPPAKPQKAASIPPPPPAQPVAPKPQAQAPTAAEQKSADDLEPLARFIASM